MYRIIEFLFSGKQEFAVSNSGDLKRNTDREIMTEMTTQED